MAPIIFSAGSLCSTLYPILTTVAQRQFYILTFPLTRARKFGLLGRFRAWDWEFGKGWGTPTRKSGLPANGGFGYRTNLTLLADQISALVANGTRKWAEIVASYPELDYLIPLDLKTLIYKLRERAIAVEPADEVPTDIGPMA